MKDLAAGLHVLMMPDYREGNPYQALLERALINAGVRVSFPVGYRRLLPIMRAIRAARPRVDVLHLHWLSPYLRGRSFATFLLYCVKLQLDLFLARWSGARIVWTVHNSVSHEARWPAAERWARRGVARLAARIIVHSESAAREIAKELRLDQRVLHVIPHGHYRAVYGPLIDAGDARTRLRLPVEAFVFLLFGYLRPYKGVEELIETWKRRAHPMPGAFLLIAGNPLDDAYAERLRRMADGQTNIRLDLRRVPDADVHLYFSAADIVALPFQRSLTSGSAILALSFGKPVIAPRLGPFEETLAGKGGLLYDPESATGLRDCLDSCRGPDSGRLRREATEAVAGLDWRSIAQRTLDLYGLQEDAVKSATKVSVR